MSAVPTFPALARPYIMAHDAQHRWCNTVAPALRVSPDSRVLYDALQLLVNQGEIFASCGCSTLLTIEPRSLASALFCERLGFDAALRSLPSACPRDRPPQAIGGPSP